MPLFRKELKEDTPFHKEDIIREIRENLSNNFHHWDWLVSKDGAFYTSDFILFRSHHIREEIHKDENIYSPYKKVIESTYQIMAVVYIDKEFEVSPNVFKGDSDSPTKYIYSIEVSSAKDLYKMIKKIDALNGG